MRLGISIEIKPRGRSVLWRVSVGCHQLTSHHVPRFVVSNGFQQPGRPFVLSDMCRRPTFHQHHVKSRRDVTCVKWRRHQLVHDLLTLRRICIRKKRASGFGRRRHSVQIDRNAAEKFGVVGLGPGSSRWRGQFAIDHISQRFIRSGHGGRQYQPGQHKANKHPAFHVERCTGSRSESRDHRGFSVGLRQCTARRDGRLIPANQKATRGLHRKKLRKEGNSPAKGIGRRTVGRLTAANCNEPHVDLSNPAFQATGFAGSSGVGIPPSQTWQGLPCRRCHRQVKHL